MKNVTMFLLLSGLCFSTQASAGFSYETLAGTPAACKVVRLSQSYYNLSLELSRLSSVIADDSTSEATRRAAYNAFYELASLRGNISACENNALLLGSIPAVEKCYEGMPQKFFPNSKCE